MGPGGGLGRLVGGVAPLSFEGSLGLGQRRELSCRFRFDWLRLGQGATMRRQHPFHRLEVWIRIELYRHKLRDCLLWRRGCVERFDVGFR